MSTVRNDFVTLSGQLTVKEAVSRLELVRETPYVLIKRSDDEFLLMSTGWLRDRLRAVADRVGEAALDLTLEQIPRLPAPCEPVDAGMATNERRKHLRRSPGGTTVELEDGEPTRILVRRGITSGLPSGLYGQRYGLFAGDIVDDSLEPRQCPACEDIFDFYEPRVENEELHFHCPHCGHRFQET